MAKSWKAKKLRDERKKARRKGKPQTTWAQLIEQEKQKAEKEFKEKMKQAIRRKVFA